MAHGTIVPVRVRSSHGRQDSSPIRHMRSIGECPYTWSRGRGWIIRLSWFECLPSLARLPPTLEGGLGHEPDPIAPVLSSPVCVLHRRLPGSHEAHRRATYGGSGRSQLRLRAEGLDRPDPRDGGRDGDLVWEPQRIRLP